jgi:hypothetical protein
VTEKILLQTMATESWLKFVQEISIDTQMITGSAQKIVVG